MTYDTKCYELAKVFLEDHFDRPPHDLCDQLAQEIQNTIEDWFLQAQNKVRLP